MYVSVPTVSDVSLLAYLFTFFININIKEREQVVNMALRVVSKFSPSSKCIALLLNLVVLIS